MVDINKLDKLIKDNQKSNTKRILPHHSQIQENNKQKSYPIVKSNILIQKSRYSLPLLQQKILLRIIQEIKPEDDILQPMHFSIKEFCELCGLNYRSGKNYKNIKDAILSIKQSSFWLTKIDDNGIEKEITVDWIAKAEIEKGSGDITITLDKDLTDYLLQLQNFFTVLYLYSTLPMTSAYSIRFYELLKSYSNMKKKEFSLIEIREMLIIDKFQRWDNFKSKILDVAVFEINAFSELQISYSTVKTGRKITGLIFSIQEKSEQEKKIAQLNGKLKLNGNFKPTKNLKM